MKQSNIGEEVKNRGGSRLPRPSGRFRNKQESAARRKRSHTLDLKKISAWAEQGCTLNEIADLLDVPHSWLEKQKQIDPDLESAILTSAANLRQSLRSKQVKLALSGHPAMLIWLGKQYLGQSDKQDQKSETTVNLVLQRAVAEMRELGRDEVLRIKQVLDGDAVTIENDQ